ncbi:MAG: sporulation integral membrane protein YtvI [Roseburia sp.]|nr:sporulation integral membrane protein YtvI [Roseburia sp.]
MKQSTKYLKILSNLLMAVGVLLFLVFALPRILGYFFPFVCGFILSLIANPVVRFLEKKIKIKRKYGSVLMIVAVIGAVVLVCYGAISALATGLESFAAYLPTMYENAGVELNEAANHLQMILDRIPFTQNIDLSEVGESLSGYVTELLSGGSEPTFGAIGDIAKRIPDILFGVIIGLLATYFFIADREKLILLIERHVPQGFRENTARVWRQIVKAVGGYFEAQLKIMVIIYIVIWIGLAILDVNYAWLIGFGIAFLDMLPVFGAGAVLWPWALIKLFSGNYMTALGMMILYAVALTVHQLVQPKLIGDSVGMDPFAALLFMFIGYKISSVVGMIVAIPVGMILINLYEVGAFDTLIWCVKEVVTDFNNFRKINKDS